MRYFVDCEFDGHGGPLLSIALLPEDDRLLSLYVTTSATPLDPWVVENVVPHLNLPGSPLIVEWDDVSPFMVGECIRDYLDGDDHPTIVADSPVDIGRFCEAVSTSSAGGWQSADYSRMSFEVHNVDCYPTKLNGAIQHNAWWDAAALREKLR